MPTLPRVPRIEVRDGEIWVCIGHNPQNESLGIVREGEYQRIRDEVAANERKRIAFVLDHMEEFASWIQWRGNPVEKGKFLEQTFPFQTSSGEIFDAKPQSTSEQ